MVTGGVLDAKEKGVPGELKMDPAMVRAVCDRAHELGYKVAARGSHSMISGESLSISRDMSVYRTHLPCIPRPAVLPRWQASGRRQVRLQRENAQT